MATRNRPVRNGGSPSQPDSPDRSLKPGQSSAVQAQTFYDRYFRQIPVLFPLVALAHVVWLGLTVVSFAQLDVLGTFIGGGTCVELLLYAVLWLAVCDMRRRAAIGYMVLTAINLGLQYLTPAHAEWRSVADALAPAHIPIDVLMCFFLLFYYKRFR